MQMKNLFLITALLLLAAPPVMGGIRVVNIVWTDGVTTIHVVNHAQGLALSGRNAQGVFLMDFRALQGHERGRRYLCSGKGYNGKGLFKLRSTVEFAGGQLRDSWTGEQEGQTVQGENILRPASIEAEPTR